MKSYYIYILRHGLTQGNSEMKYIGHTNESLSEEGISQIKEMMKDYNYPDVEVIFSSPLKRCLETAKLIYPGVEPITMEGFIEYDFGYFEGKTAEQLKDHPVFPDWLAGKPGVSAPFGESNEHFAKRIAETFIKTVDGLIKTGTTKCAIITHGGVMNALLSFFGLPEVPMHEWATSGGCGYVLKVTPSLWSQAQKLEVVAQLPFVPGESENDYMSAGDYFASDPLEGFDYTEYLYD